MHRSYIYKKLIMVVFILIVSLMPITNVAAEVYSKPEFRGRVIDAETKQPIEGAVVVVLYYKRPLVGGPGGPNAYVFEAKETLTDRKGEFYFPAYSSLLAFTEDAGVKFIFFKPGYMSITDKAIDTGIAETRIGLDKYLATDIIGKEAEFTLNSFAQGKIVKWKGPLGIVTLVRAKTREDLMRGSPGAPSADYRSNRLPLLFKAINEDRRNRGLEGDIK